MTSIFDCEEYTRKQWPPYMVDNASYGRPADTVVFFFAYTPTGRVSKYWAAWTCNYALRDKQRRLERYIERGLPNTTGKLKGYRWSRPYLYSGNPKEWEGLYEADVCSE